MVDERRIEFQIPDLRSRVSIFRSISPLDISMGMVICSYWDEGPFPLRLMTISSAIQVRVYVRIARIPPIVLV